MKNEKNLGADAAEVASACPVRSSAMSDKTEPRPSTTIQLPDDVSEKMAENAAFVAQRRQADKLRAVADWFTDCKNLNLEQLPVGLIAALRAGADALIGVSSMRDLAKSWRLTGEAHGNQAFVICAQELVNLLGSGNQATEAEPAASTRRSEAQK